MHDMHPDTERHFYSITTMRLERTIQQLDDERAAIYRNLARAIIVDGLPITHPYIKDQLVFYANVAAAAALAELEIFEQPHNP
jgi:secreted protein with Ig-like and vWFA domain